MKLVVCIWFLVFGAVTSSSSIEKLRGCSVGSNKKGTSTRSSINLANLENNIPKKNEIFRVSVIFPWKKPVFGIVAQNSTWNYYFGKF